MSEALQPLERIGAGGRVGRAGAGRDVGGVVADDV